MALTENKSERIEIRTTPNIKALLQQVAASSHKNAAISMRCTNIPHGAMR